MPHQRLDRGSPLSLTIHSHNHDLSRRAFLRALGLGVVSVAGVGEGANLASAQTVSLGPDATPAASPSPAATASIEQKRAPGGPSVEQLLLDLDYDAEKIFRFVADEVAYEAYPGVLRGAKGTHWSLAGNSVDKALFLAALLTEAQVPVRFAAGPLNAGVADQLLAQMHLDAEAAKAQAARLVSDMTMQLDRYPELTPEQRAVLQSPDALRKQLLDRATTHLRAGLDTVKAALTAGGITLPQLKPTVPDRERDQHVWVQYADGPRWVDLDPSLAKAESGKALARQTATWDSVDAIPAELYHRVRFRAILESSASGVVAQEDVLVYEGRAADLVGVPVVFAHVQPDAISQLGVSIGGVVEGTMQYVPSILAGDDGELGAAITLGGGGGFVGALGGESGSDGPIAEWLEVTSLAPDMPEQRITREVFDRVGLDRRAAGPIDPASLPPIELIDDPKLGKVFLPLEAVWLHGVVGGGIPSSYFDQDYTIPDVPADMAVLVHGYYGARAGLQTVIAAAEGSRWYHDRPNVTAAILAPTNTTGEITALAASLDVMIQGYATHPLAGSTVTAHPQVLAGVLAHVAEVVGAETGADLTQDAPTPIGGSVAQVFAVAATDGVAIRSLIPAASSAMATPMASPGVAGVAAIPPEVAALDVSEAAKVRIAEAMASGYVVIVPERAVDLGGVKQVGWWQVDPSTGRTFDLMENGRGASPMTEDTVIIVGGPAWRAAVAIKALYFVMGFVIAFSAAMAIMMYPN